MVAAETILAGALAALVGLLPAARWPRWTPLAGLAAGAIFFPVFEDLIGFLRIAPLITRPTTLDPYTVRQLAELPWRLARDTLTVPILGLGAVALLGGAGIARRHLRAFWPGWRGLGRQVGLGWATVPVVIGAEAVALILLAGPASFLNTGNEAALFANATWEHVILLSLVPGIVEEIYYRGLVQGLLEKMLPARFAIWGAIGIQGVLFAVAHAGFANLAHVLGPLAFGLGMGYLRGTLGLGACVVAHAGVNLFYFSVDPGAGSPELQVAAAVLAVLGTAVLWLARRTLAARIRAGPRLGHVPERS